MLVKRCGVVTVAIGLIALASAGASARSAAVGAPPGLERFSSCESFLAYVKEQALALPGPWNSLGPPPPSSPNTVAMPATPPTVAGAGGTDHSVTNVQEAGVDEPDIVKTDGSRIFAIAKQALYAVGVGKRHPHLLGSVPLERGTDHELLLYGNRLLVLSRGGFPPPPTPTWEVPSSNSIPPGPLPPNGSGGILPAPGLGTTLTEVDVSDPTAMRVVRTLSVDASYLSARLVGPSARVVLTSSIPHGLAFVAPTAWDDEAIAEARTRNRAVVDSSTAANWLPDYVLDDSATGSTTTGSVLGCDQVSRPPEFSGLGMLSVLTIDLAKGLRPVDADGVLADGQTVYASPHSLYVATQSWENRQPLSDVRVVPGSAVGSAAIVSNAGTALHKFSISDREDTEYRASGVVSGSVRDQWSLSEQNGLLRVASTTVSGETFVTVLNEEDGNLLDVGQVGGLGRGEDVYAVRFIGDAGYVVTFRRTDPLYTIDLSRPEHPRILGKLKLLGWSAYLHPLGDDLLLGVGQDATPSGMGLGTQLSVFDVSNLRSPSRLDRRTISRGVSEAENDHHAFLYWQPSRLVVVPVAPSGDSKFVGALAFRLSRSLLEEVGRIEGGGRLYKLGRIAHWSKGARAPISRSLVARGTLYTVSELGIRANDATTLADEGWAGFSESVDSLPRGARSD
jgi:hypothetical protein